MYFRFVQRRLFVTNQNNQIENYKILLLLEKGHLVALVTDNS